MIPPPPPRCACGTYIAVQHVCDHQRKNPLKHGERGPLGPRCPGCGTLHASLEHVCPKRDAILARSAQFTDNPKTELEALDQWRRGWRPANMCMSCPGLQTPCSKCWERAGYKPENYARQFAK